MASHTTHKGFLATIIVLSFSVFYGPLTGAAAEKPVLRDGMENFVIHAAAKEVVDIEFKNGQGADIRLSGFRGKLVLLNFWATWCAPCRREMTDLDDLQKALGSKTFHVLALSSDRQGLPRVTEFYQQMKISYLEKYLAGGLQAARDFRVLGLPVSVLISAKGKEIGRMIGPADWNGPAARGLIEFYLARK